ncbi:uncharacterized protein IL334_004091 [Kwoniella shivajii]|uniref:Chromo domain-containing protein n=1 Tax=Kwoniella shivajii TaxID=564305 RepID=A0ABZ1CZR9_9TREE|nr:hypothetical protein IL334_004091 [Kwoniella shivajii]
MLSFLASSSTPVNPTYSTTSFQDQRQGSMPPPSSYILPTGNGEASTSSSFLEINGESSSSSSFSQKIPRQSEVNGGPSRHDEQSRTRRFRPTSSSPSPSLGLTPAPSITQELFRITQLLFSFDNESRKYRYEAEKRLETLEETFDERMKSFNHVLKNVEGLLEEEKGDRNEIRELVQGLSNRMESLENVCKSRGNTISISNTTSRENTILSSISGPGHGPGSFNSYHRSNCYPHGENQGQINQLDSITRENSIQIELPFSQQNSQQNNQNPSFPSLDEQSTQDHTNEENETDSYQARVEESNRMNDTFSHDLPLEIDGGFDSDIGEREQEKDMTDQGIFMDIDDTFQPVDMELGIDPRDIMRPPEISTDILVSDNAQVPEEEEESSGSETEQTGKEMTKKVAAVISRSKGKQQAESTSHSHTQSPEVDTTAHFTRSQSRPARTQRYNPPSSSHSDSSSSSAEEDEEEEEEGSSRPPARLPFPPRQETSPSQTKRRARLRESQNNPESKQQRSNRASSSELTQAFAGPSDYIDLDSPSAEPDEPDRKRRRKSGRWAKKDTRQPSTRKNNKGKGRQRKFYGQVRLAMKCLAMSDGQKVTTAEWPKKGPNTARGRLEEIVCDLCKGRCHWSCAGIPEDRDMSDETWLCPDCIYLTEVDELPRQMIDTVQQIRCIRFNCILREKRAIDHMDGEEEMYFVEKIVGRKAVAREPDSNKRIFVYLVKWDGYGLDECTWEPNENLGPKSVGLKDAFEQSAKKTKSDLKVRVCVLPEAREYWAQNTGEPVVDIEDSRVESVEAEQMDESVLGDGRTDTLTRIQDVDEQVMEEELVEETSVPVDLRPKDVDEEDRTETVGHDETTNNNQVQGSVRDSSEQNEIVDENREQEQEQEQEQDELEEDSSEYMRSFDEADDDRQNGIVPDEENVASGDDQPEPGYENKGEGEKVAEQGGEQPEGGKRGDEGEGEDETDELDQDGDMTEKTAENTEKKKFMFGFRVF